MDDPGTPKLENMSSDDSRNGFFNQSALTAVRGADPWIGLRGGGGGARVGFVLVAPWAFLPSVISSFLPKIKGGGGARPPGPSPRSANVNTHYVMSQIFRNSSWRFPAIIKIHSSGLLATLQRCPTPVPPAYLCLSVERCWFIFFSDYVFRRR